MIFSVEERTLMVADCDLALNLEQAEANAALLAHRWNRFDEIVEALEALYALHDPDGRFEPHRNKAPLLLAKQTLERAKTVEVP